VPPVRLLHRREATRRQCHTIFGVNNTASAVSSSVEFSVTSRLPREEIDRRNEEIEKFLKRKSITSPVVKYDAGCHF